MQELPPDLVSFVGSCMSPAGLRTAGQTCRLLNECISLNAHHWTVVTARKSPDWLDVAPRTWQSVVARMPHLRDIAITAQNDNRFEFVRGVVMAVSMVAKGYPRLHGCTRPRINLRLNDKDLLEALTLVLLSETETPVRLYLYKPYDGEEYDLSTLRQLTACPHITIEELYISYPSKLYTPDTLASLACSHMSLFINSCLFEEHVQLQLDKLECRRCTLVCNNMRSFRLGIPHMPQSVKSVVVANTNLVTNHSDWFCTPKIAASAVSEFQLVNHRMPLLRDNLVAVLRTLGPLSTRTFAVGVPVVALHKVMDVIVEHGQDNTVYMLLHNGSKTEKAMAVLGARLLLKFKPRLPTDIVPLEFYGEVDDCEEELASLATATLLTYVDPALAWHWKHMLA